MYYDYLVIGAGAAGLSFTALMEKKLNGNGRESKKTIALLEAHSLSGGCASYFERQGFLFDAGATTLSGLKDNRPLQKLFSDLDLQLELLKVDPGIISLFPDKKVSHYSDNEKWVEELDKHFPQINNREVWDKIFAISDQGWLLSKNFPELPLLSWTELLNFFKKETLQSIKLLPHLFTSVEKSLALNQINDQEYLALINELLFITAQNTAKDTPMLMGSMGLSYPDDTWYPIGGMKSLATALEKKCSHLYFRHKVLSLKKESNGFTVVTNKGTFTCGTLISSLPEWNHNDLFGETLFPEKTTENCWSAYMLYMTVPKSKREGIYFQVHCDAIPYCESKSFFVSLSHPDDPVRSQNRQTVTISCHTKPAAWENLPQEEYKRRKKITEDFILDVFCKRFSLAKEDLANIMTGSPETFLKYTHRYKGLVGGIPHSLGKNPLEYMISRSPFKHFHLIGDTQFPGQGIAAVVLGAQNLAEKLE